jgi:hypothetical protein
MAERKKAAKPATTDNPKVDPNILGVRDGVDGVKKGQTQSQTYAALATRSVLAVHTMKSYSGFPKDQMAVTDLQDEMRRAGDEVVAGDLGRVERSLMNQFMSLDAIFCNLAERSHRQEYMAQMETFMRLALKAQAQARATAEALALLKNPQPYIKQANIAQGHQQVNNTYASASPHNGIPEFQDPYTRTCAGNSDFVPNKLLEKQDAVTLDTRAQGAAVSGNQAMATLD